MFGRTLRFDPFRPLTRSNTFYSEMNEMKKKQVLLCYRLDGKSVFTHEDEYRPPNRWKNSYDEWNLIWNASYQNVYVGETFCKIDRIMSQVKLQPNLISSRDRVVIKWFLFTKNLGRKSMSSDELTTSVRSIWVCFMCHQKSSFSLLFSCSS